MATTVDFLTNVLKSADHKSAVLLVDADSIVWQAGYACQTTVYEVFNGVSGTIDSYYNLSDLKNYFESWYKTKYKVEEVPKNLLTRKGIIAWSNQIGSTISISERVELEPIENCLHTVKQMIEGIRKKCNVPPTNMVLFAGAKNNFRPVVDPTYKANRTQPKPEYYEKIMEYIEKKYNLHQPEGYEADDAVGIGAEFLKGQLKMTIMAHIDKDLDQLEGFHYSWTKGYTYVVSSHEAAYKFYIQMLVGDSSDNVRGVPKIGQKTAAKLLPDWQHHTSQSMSASQYTEKLVRIVGLQYAIAYDDPEAEMQNTYNMLRILTKEPTDEDNQTP